MTNTTKRTVLALALSFGLASTGVPADAKNDRHPKKGKAHQQQREEREARPKAKHAEKRAAQVRSERERERQRLALEQQAQRQRFQERRGDDDDRGRRRVSADRRPSERGFHRSERLSAQRQQLLIQEHRSRTARYHHHLERQENLAQQRLVALQRQRRAAQHRFHQQYLERLHRQRLALQRAYDYSRDPFYYTAPSYRYARQGRYYEINQYAAQLLQEAVNLGYQEGLRSGQADRLDRWDSDYRNCYAYQDANFGYDGRYVDQAEYNYYFREGFRRGYEDGHGSRMQYGHQRGGGSFGIIAEVLVGILELQALR